MSVVKKENDSHVEEENNNSNNDNFNQDNNNDIKNDGIENAEEKIKTEEEIDE